MSQNKPLLQLDQAQFCLEGKPLIHSFHWSVKPGEVWAVLGVNGSGKSTLLRWIAGLPLHRSFGCKGQLTWSGLNPEDLSRRRRADLLAWMPQDDPMSFDCTVSERVMAGQFLGRSFFGWDTEKDLQKALEVLGRYDLHGKSDRLLTELSGGERRRVSVAAAQLQNAAVTLLDEPFSQLDWAHQVQIGKAFKSWPGLADKAVVWVTHEPNMALRFSTHLLAIDQTGHVLKGPVCDMARPDLLAAVYGCEMESSDNPFLFFPKV